MDTKIVSCCVTDAPVCTSVPSPPLSCHPRCLASRLRTTSTLLSVFRGECPSQRIKWHSISQEIFQHLPTFRLLDSRSRCSLSVHSKYFEVAPRQRRYDIIYSLYLLAGIPPRTCLHLSLRISGGEETVLGAAGDQKPHSRYYVYSCFLAVRDDVA